jgi:hypothetical protein
MFEGDDLNHAMGIPFFYGMCEAALVGTYCILGWKAGWSKAPAEAPIWDVVFRTYEVLEAERQDVCEVEISVSSGSQDSRDRQEGPVFHKFFEMEDQTSSSMNSTPSLRPKEPSGGIPEAIAKYQQSQL